MTTPIAQLELAIAGRVKYVKDTWIWGPSKEDEEERRMREQVPDRGGAVQRLLAFVGARQAQDRRNAKPKR